MSEMQTAGHRAFSLADIDANVVDAYDVAISLGRQCRFTGHLPVHYSVAEHCVLMSQVITPTALAKQALVHDSPEMVVADLSSPLKHLPELAGYRAVEARVWRLMARTFGVPEVLDAAVHVLDRQMGCVEALALMRPLVPSWHAYIAETVAAYGPLPRVELKCWSPNEAAARFLQRLDELSNDRGPYASDPHLVGAVQPGP